MSDKATSERLDVWLFRTRLIKSRSQAVHLIEKGKVRLTDHTTTRRITKPGYRLSIGDELTFMRGTTLFQLEVLSFPERRGPAAEARDSYRIIDMQTRTRDDS